MEGDTLKEPMRLTRDVLDASYMKHWKSKTVHP